MVRALVQRSGLCPYIKILDILKLISLVFSVFQRIIKLSKPTKEWRPSIEKETGMAMKPVEASSALSRDRCSQRRENRSYWFPKSWFWWISSQIWLMIVRIYEGNKSS